MATRAFAWNDAKRRAAVLVAEDDLTDAAIAAEVGVHRITLEKWKRNPDFAAQVGDHAGEIARNMLRLAIAKKHKRVSTLDDLHRRANTVIHERAKRYAASADTAEQSARRVFGNDTPPEAATGILVKQESITPQGLISTEWKFDAALFREIRALEQQAAQELGQWVEKSETTHDATESFLEALRAFGNADAHARR